MSCRFSIPTLSEAAGAQLPYGVTQAEFGDPGYTGYRVNASVASHDAWGVGVYTYFRDHDVTVESGIVCPKALEPNFRNPLSIHLNGIGRVNHVINGVGVGTNVNQKVNYVC